MMKAGLLAVVVAGILCACQIGRAEGPRAWVAASTLARISPTEKPGTARTAVIYCPRRDSIFTVGSPCVGRQTHRVELLTVELVWDSAGRSRRLGFYRPSHLAKEPDSLPGKVHDRSGTQPNVERTSESPDHKHRHISRCSDSFHRSPQENRLQAAPISPRP
jgi:hypothetical protein